VSRHGFADDLAKIRGESQVSAFVELRRIEAGPASVDFAALHRAAQNKHHVGMAVISAAIAVLACRAADSDMVTTTVSSPRSPRSVQKAASDCEKSRSTLAIWPLGCSFVHVMIPATYVSKGHLHSEVCLDELRELAQAVAEAPLGIIGARRRLVLRRVRGLQHSYRVKRFFSGAVQARYRVSDRTWLQM